MRGLGFVKRCAVVNFLRFELTFHELQNTRHHFNSLISLLAFTVQLSFFSVHSMIDELGKFHSHNNEGSHSKEMFVNYNKTTGEIKGAARLASSKQCSG